MLLYGKKPYKKFWGMTNAALSGAAPPAVGPPYVFRNVASTSASGAVFSTSIDIGTASADRLVVVATATQNAVAVSTVVVHGVTLTADVNSAAGAAIFSGLVTSGSGPQTVTVTWASGTFNMRGFSLWTVTGLSSNVVKQTGSGTTSATINVTAGDLMFSSAEFSSAGTASWSISTQVPAATHGMFVANPGGTGADWTIASTNASFSVNPNIGNLNATVAATYR
jgi:hypothetical protein